MSPDTRRNAPVFRAAAVAGLCGAYLLAMGVEPTAHSDTARDILLARDGLATGTFVGCDSSFGSFRQGALWVRFMAVTFALGLGPVVQHVAIAAWLILGVCAFDFSVRRHFGDDIGWQATAMFLASIIVAVGYPNLWNPTIASLGVALLTWALLEVVTHGSTAAACATGACLALTAEASWSAFLIGPVVALAVIMSSRRPWIALSLSFASALIPSLAWSYTTWNTNLQALLRESWQAPFLAAAVAIGLAAGFALRPRWLALAAPARRRWLLAMSVGAIVSLALIASVLAQRPLISPQYLFTALPAAIILVALGLRRLRRRPSTWPHLAAAIPVFLLVAFPMSAAWIWRFGVATGRASIPSYSMREAKILADHLYGIGLSFGDLQRHLRGPNDNDLMYALAAYTPRPQPAPARAMPDLRVLAFRQSAAPSSDLARKGEHIDLGRGRTAWILPIDGWVGLAPSRVCFSSTRGEAVEECADIRDPTVPLGGRYRDLTFPAFPGVRDAYLRFTKRAPGIRARTRWELPVTIDDGEPERHVRLASIVAIPWKIERVEGVGFRGSLPARSVVIDRSASRSGRLVVAVDRIPNRDYPPEILESRPEEAWLRRSLDELPPFGRYVCTTLGTCS